MPRTTSAQTEFEGAVTMNMNMGGALSIDVVSLTKAGKVRQEMTMMGQEVISIVDASAGTGLMLMPLQKSYMKLDFNALARRMGPMPPPKITATGTTETILGHTCEHYTVEMPSGTTAMCVATDLGFYMGSLNAQGGGMAGSSNLQAYNELFRTKFKNGFFPLELTVTSQGMAMTVVVTKIEAKPVSDDLFELDVPADYTEMKMPVRGTSGGPR
jgi:hypothetical protein